MRTSWMQRGICGRLMSQILLWTGADHLAWVHCKSFPDCIPACDYLTMSPDFSWVCNLYIRWDFYPTSTCQCIM